MFSLNRKIACLLVVILFCAAFCAAQTAVVTRNVYLRPGPSTDNHPITKLLPDEKVQLLAPDAVNGFYHAKTDAGQIGYVWSRNVRVESGRIVPSSTTSSTTSVSGPAPLLAKGHPVAWWFVFKFNSASFPGCGGTAARTCPFGGTVQSYQAFSQQYVFASSEVHKLQQGADCLGDTTTDPVGATFEQIYDGTYYYVVWNDQFYKDPEISGCGDSCGAPWGHSKGLLAWDESGNGVVLQVTTPSWPASGSKVHPRKSDGNTLGCVNDNDVKVSQHFFALKLNKDDVLKVLKALINASVVTDPANPQIVYSGGPVEIQGLVTQLGTRSKSTTYTKEVLSTGVELISKPSKLNVPPWQMVSALLGGIPLRTATWWSHPYIYSTTNSTNIACWDGSLSNPAAVEIATTGSWNGTVFGLKGGGGKDFNHAKIGVSTSGTSHLAIFGDMNQQGTISGPNCASSQNGRGGLFFVIDDQDLSTSLTDLIRGNSAPLN